jgi:ABC-type glycerol-3-phosphate transport system permease component
MRKMAKRFFRRRISRSTGGDMAMTLFLILVAAAMGIPLVFAVSMSLKSPHEFWVFPPTFIARNPTFQNFSDLFTLMSSSWVPMSRYFFNTVFLTVSATTGHVVLASMAAFALSKYKFPGSAGLFVIIRSSLMFTGPITGIANFMIMSKLGWLDTYWAVIIPAFGGSLGLFLMKQFMDQMIPVSVIESASIDGASEWRKFWFIVMPMVKPAWLTLIIFTIQGTWNMGDNQYIYSEQLKTFSYALSQIAAAGIARAGVGAAISVFMLLVPLAVFIVNQSNIIETMSTSGMKD